jgi:hydrogenase expression/formation protein HypD
MNNESSFSNPSLVRELVARIGRVSIESVNIMEFCGTHSHAIHRHGIRRLLPETVRMFSGPGCPVCVTDSADVDYAVALARVPGVTIATFGDMLRVPSSRGSLLTERAQGARIEVVYSSLSALDYAADNPKEEVVFLGIGFETTAPTVAASILQAKERNINNYSVLSLHKVTPPAMSAILQGGEISVDGVICPGHVSVITGWEAWRFLADRYRIPAVVAGFEPVDILLAVEEIVRQHEAGEARVKNVYPRGVTAQGNPLAHGIMNRVFRVDSARWRGMGTILQSGLTIRDEYEKFDSRHRFEVELPEIIEPVGCRCGDILRGIAEPQDCSLFKRPCTPSNPLGPCMVSSEGSCAACYHYG